MTDYKTTEKSDVKLPDEETSQVKPTPSDSPRLLKIFAMSVVFGLVFFRLLSYATPLLQSYLQPVPKASPHGNFRPPSSYSGDDQVTARVCVTSVAPRVLDDTPKELSAGELDAGVADMLVANAFQRKEDMFLAGRLFTGANFDTCAIGGPPLRLWVTKAHWPESTCEKPESCVHLKKAVYEGFGSLTGELPGVQCIAARDSLGNEIAFSWGTDWSHDREEDQVVNAKCVYNEDAADEVVEVGEGLEVTRLLP